MRSFYLSGLIAAALPLAAVHAQTAAQAPRSPSNQMEVPFVKADAEAAVAALATQLDENFVFPDKAKAYAAMLRANLAAGKYASFANGFQFAEAVTADLQAVHKDGHLKVRPVPRASAGGGSGPVGGGPPPGFKFISKSGWLADGVAYIRFEAFPGNEPTLAQLRTFLAAHKDANSLIIDLRSNRGGGLAEMDVLFPAIFAKETPLVMMDTRLAAEENDSEGIEKSLRTVAGPQGVVRRVHVATPAPGQSALAKAKVYVLTSSKTVSAGEHFSLALKRTHRATLIGETTRGAGHYGGVVELGKSGYGAFIPVGRTFDPDTNQGWEGTGVKPDIAVAADKALDEALKLAGVNASGEAALASLE